jgi:hypothetical protein
MEIHYLKLRNNFFAMKQQNLNAIKLQNRNVIDTDKRTEKGKDKACTGTEKGRELPTKSGGTGQGYNHGKPTGARLRPRACEKAD